MGAAVAVAVMRRKEEEVRGDFMRAGATLPLNAMSLADVGLEENHTVRRLVKRAVIREAAPGMFYFDDEVYQSVRGMRRRMIFIMLLAVVLFAIVATYGSTKLK